MKFGKLPIPYIYFILAGIAFGILMALKSYLPFLYWEETGRYVWQKYAAPHLINYGLWGFLVPFVYYFSQKYPIFRTGASNTIKIKALLASFGLAFFHEAFSNVVWFLPQYIFDIDPITEDVFDHIIGMFPSAFISRLIEYWIIFAVFTAIDYQRKYRNKQLQLAKLENQLSGAQLNALRLQLQPHFLFNTLNTISSLMEISTKDAQRIISKLGNLLRTVLEKNKRNKTPLREELAFIKSYLDIEQVRFSDRLEIEYDIDNSSLDVLVPSLILQPLVENAIKHGFSNRSEDGKIVVSTERKGSYLELYVADDGIGTERSMENLLASGIGLKNVKERLELLYKSDFQMDIQSRIDGGFKIVLQIPVEREY